ncbi:DsbA family protein [Brevundimonas sp. PAMC22021]|nr:DsbA family protein [Brevundimonas sp. PAMC22021]
MSRRAAITGAALAAMALSACGGNKGGSAEGDMALGAPDGTKVTVVEYASVTCGHCALWQQNTWPAFKAKYVDTNKVRYVFRELPTPPVDVATAGFLVARCAGDDKYFQVVHQLLATQQEMVTGSPRDWLLRTAQAAGMNEQQFADCVSDRDAVAALEQRIQQAQAQGVTGTPAFFVNEQEVITPGSSEGPSLADLSTAIDAELAK